MRLSELSLVEINTYAREFVEAGVVVLPAVLLPPTFGPAASCEFAFVRKENKCEVFIEAQATYQGAGEFWADVARREPVAGCKLVETLRGDFVTGFRALSRRLGREPEEPPASPDISDQPDPLAERPTRQVPPPVPDGELRNLVEGSDGRQLSRTGREDLLRALKTNLVRESKPGVVLVGPPGVGKTSLVALLAADIASGRELPQRLVGKALLELPLGQLVENASSVGALEREARRVLSREDRPIFFIDEIHQLARPALKPLCDLIKPALQSGEIVVVGATTPIEWRALEDGAFKRRFLELEIPEPSMSAALELLTPRLGDLERHHRLSIDHHLLSESILLSNRYMPRRALPDKALDLLDQAAAMQVIGNPEGEGADEYRSLSRPYLIEAVRAASGLALDLLDHEGVCGLADRLTGRLETELVGQGAAITKVVALLKSQSAARFIGWEHGIDQLRDTMIQAPLATVFSAGPTGVGKSQTARLLADELFEGRLVVLSGTDVGREAPHGIATWVGSPPGYVGSAQGGKLTNALRTNGAQCILIDEIEKASTEAIQNVLLPLLGDGVVVDRNNGEELSAVHCVVICTSNLKLGGGRSGGLGFSGGGGESRGTPDLTAALREHFSSELVGRFNAVVGYVPLCEESLLDIWERLSWELQEQTGVSVLLTESGDAQVRTWLANKSNAGARGVRDLFRTQVLHLVVDEEPGSIVRLEAKESCGLSVERPREESIYDMDDELDDELDDEA